MGAVVGVPRKSLVLCRLQRRRLLAVAVAVRLDPLSSQVAAVKVGVNQDKLTLVAAEAAAGIMVVAMVKDLLVVLESFVSVIQSNICPFIMLRKISSVKKSLIN